MYKKEDSIFIPPGNNEKLWKYMDFLSLISILENSILWFSRVDRLRDPFEGLYPKFNEKKRKEVYEGKIPEDVLEKMSKTLIKFRKYALVNCWHLNEFQSAAMWDLYATHKYGIAIQTTFERLCESFSSESKDIYIGKVKYIDYDSEWMPEGNIFYPFMHKRKSFAHELEVRAVYTEFPINGEEMKLDQPIYDEGKGIKIDVSKLIQNIYIAPTTPNWILELVDKLIKKYNITATVIRSDLYCDPLK